MMALFKPFRALGYVTDDTPFAVQRRGKETLVTLSVGQSWQVYDCSKLTLTLVGPQLGSAITALAAKGDLTYAAIGNVVVVCKRVHRIAMLKTQRSSEIVQLMCLDRHLLALGSGAQGTLQVWQQDDWEDGPESEISFGNKFEPTCMAHPDTYLNKVIVGAVDGRVQLWNFSSVSMLYEFSGWGSAVRCLVPSPVLDVAGIGLADGRVVVHNLRLDEQVVQFENAAGLGTSMKQHRKQNTSLLGVLPSSHGCAVSSIAFRDASCGVPILAAAGSSGAITLWNLQERRLHAITRDAHIGRVCSIHFFAGVQTTRPCFWPRGDGEPLLMSIGSDNSVKQWLLDSPEGPPRLLRFRAGHAAPPTIIRHYGNGTAILSAGSDLAFRMFSCIQDQQSKELSQRNVERRAKKMKLGAEELKLPRIVALHACQVRERDWANVVTAHEGEYSAYTWLLKDAAIGKHILTPPGSLLLESEHPSPITSVAISCCGNFAMTGSSAGLIHRFNLQSGLHRGTYCLSDGASAHEGIVAGLASDSSNHSLISCGCDGWLRRWGFKSRKPTGGVEIGHSADKMSFNAASGLVAIACNDLGIYMYDIEALTLVRRFHGHVDRITDICISADARWLLTASMDGTLRVWDVPGARILQVLDMGAAVTSLSLSPAMEMLATAHPERNGIYLWSNTQIFQGASSISAAANNDAFPVHAHLSFPHLGRSEGAEDGDDEEVDEVIEKEIEMDEEQHAKGYSSSVLRDGDGRIQADLSIMDPQLSTLSLLPRNQWESLAVLDIIKERNKPQEPVKKPEAAPFFLPTIASENMGRQPVFDLTATQGGKYHESHITKKLSMNAETEFGRALSLGRDTGDFSALLSLLKTMNPSAIDVEIRARQLLEGCTEDEVEEVQALLHFVELQIASKKNFEFIQGFFRAFLKIHADALVEHASLSECVDRIYSLMHSSWSKLDSKFSNMRCVLAFFCGQT